MTRRNLGQLIVAKRFEKLPKVQKIAKSGHTEDYPVIFWPPQGSVKVFFTSAWNNYPSSMPQRDSQS